MGDMKAAIELGITLEEYKKNGDINENTHLRKKAAHRYT